MNSTVLSFLLVVAVAAFTADAMVFGVPMGGLWRNYGGLGSRGPFGFNFMPSGNQGFKFVPAALVGPPSSSSDSGSNGNAPSVNTLTGIGNGFVPLGGIPAGLSFPY